MPKIISVGTFDPPHEVTQATIFAAAKEHFKLGFSDIGRLLEIFRHTEIERRFFSVPLEWFYDDHSLRDRNDTYIKLATEFGIGAINACLHNTDFLEEEEPYEEIDAIIFVSTTGMATPSIEARIMNKLPFSAHTKRIPIWGLGCAGGGAGIARAAEYCTAYPHAKVLVIALELCSLTFQKKDLSKSNLVGAALFADGAACALVAGELAQKAIESKREFLPRVKAHQTTLMRDSESVMGWDIKDEGLFVVFSKDIPTIIRGWLRSNVDEFLEAHSLTRKDIRHFVAHPGGKKILEAYQDALEITEEMTAIPRDVLRLHGNMSSPSVLYVLKEYMKSPVKEDEIGLMAAMGPGFTSELLLLRWEA